MQGPILAFRPLGHVLAESRPYVNHGVPVVLQVPENFTIADWQRAVRKMSPLCQLPCEALSTEEGQVFRIEPF